MRAPLARPPLGALVLLLPAALFAGACSRPLESRPDPAPQATPAASVRFAGASDATPAPPGAKLEAPEARPFAVVELFTSQGCSSCPPADRQLRALAEEADRRHERLFPLSMHVDYWNYLGWTDPFSDGAYSERQRQYSLAFRRRGAYTPQAVVNGREEMVGSHGAELRRAVKRALSTPARAGVALSARRRNNHVDVAFRVAAPEPFELVIVLAQPRAETSISRGENGGRTIEYRNVARALEVRAAPAPAAGTWKARWPERMPAEGAFVVAYAAAQGTHMVLGAERADVELE